MSGGWKRIPPCPTGMAAGQIAAADAPEAVEQLFEIEVLVALGVKRVEQPCAEREKTGLKRARDRHCTYAVQSEG